MHPADAAATDHNHVGVLGHVNQSRHRSTGNQLALNAQIIAFWQGFGNDVPRIGNDLFSSAVVIRPVVRRRG